MKLSKPEHVVCLQTDVETYWQAVEDAICTKCVDGDAEGNCRLPAGFKCELREYFPIIVRVISDVYSERIDEYIEQLRRQVCTQCSCLKADNTCRRRADTECALDRYYPLVISAIETVNREASSTSRVPLKDENLPRKDEEYPPKGEYV